MLIIMAITIGITTIIEKQIIAVLLLSVLLLLLLLYFISAFQFYTFLITALNASCGAVY